MKNWDWKNELLLATITIFIFITISIFTSCKQAYANMDERSSIVKIYTVSAEPFYHEPWTNDLTQYSSGSGCVIKGNRILTNAHVISDQTFVQVSLYGKPEKYPAKIIAVSHESDLALLTVDDLSFFDGVKPLIIGKLPEIQQDVIVYGFPEGGETLSVTKGIVSRIEHSQYVHSQLKLLSAQIDAPINAGNSGGPVLIDGKISGVVMQGIDDSQSIGYMVPAPIIKHFIDDLKDSRCDGFPTLGITYQKIENEALRAKYNFSERQSGVLVTYIAPGSSTVGKLHIDDVILSIDDKIVAGDGTIEFRQNERTSLGYCVQKHQIGEELKLNVMRNGGVHTIKIVLKTPAEKLELVPRQLYDIRPSYYIYGGLLFMPLTRNYLMGWGDDDWDEDAPSKLVTLYKHGRLQSINNEIVILSKALPAKINRGYHNYSELIITHVDDNKINNLKNLIRMVEKNRKKKFVEFKTKGGLKIVLNREQAQADLPKILKTYNVPYDRSENFR
jgi:S1-C subfamily serine protease